MKDFTLSEIKTKCTGNCFKCDERNEELSKFCRRFIKTHDDCEMPRDWDIEPRDMIELPCKEHFFCMRDDGHITENWRVFYRGEFALIETAIFPTEPEADAFLAKKKTEKEKDDLLFAELKEAEVKFYDAFNRLSYKKRTEGKFGDADVGDLLAAYERMCEIEKKRRMRK